MRQVLVAAVVVALGSGRSARADPSRELATLDGEAAESTATLAFRYEKDCCVPPGYDYTPLSTSSMDLGARHVTRWHVGAYGHALATRGGRYGEAAVGVEAGALYVARLAAWSDLVVHAGLARAYVRRDAQIGLEQADPSRLPGYWLRLGASLVARHGRWFYQLDLDVDGASGDSTVPGWEEHTQVSPFLRGGGGAGIVLGHFEYTVALSCAQHHRETAHIAENVVRSIVAIGARLDERTHPALAIVAGRNSYPNGYGSLVLALVVGASWP